MSSLKSFKLGNCLILPELGGHQANILHFSFTPIENGENLSGGKGNKVSKIIVLKFGNIYHVHLNIYRFSYVFVTIFI